MTMALPEIYWDNRLDDATPVASTTATGYNVLNLRAWRPYLWWKPTALPATVTVDGASAHAADSLFVWGHDLYTQGATIEVHGSTDNFSGSDVTLSTLTPTSNDPFVMRFTSASYRYWRIRITGTTMPSISVACLGAALQLPTYLKTGFDPIGQKRQGMRARAVKGAPLGTLLTYVLWEETIALDDIEWTWLRSTFIPAWEARISDEPFGFCWDPGDHPTELILATSVDGSFDARHKFGSYADLSFKIQGLPA